MAKPIFPIRAAGSPAGPPPYGGLGVEAWVRGVTFLDWVEAAGAQRAAIEAAFRTAAPPPEAVAFFAGWTRRVRVMAFATADDLDARSNLAPAERLFVRSGAVWMRVFDPTTESDMVERLAAGRPLPHLVLWDGEGREIGRWGPRPRALEAELAALPAAQHAEHAARFYAASRGRHLADELRRLLEGQAGGPA
jgi:hypothetical protein